MKVKAFGGGKFPCFFRHEFELLRRTKEAERAAVAGRKDNEDEEARLSAKGKEKRRASTKEDDERGKGVKTVVIGGS